VKLTNRLPSRVNIIDNFQMENNNRIKYLINIYLLLFKTRRYDVLLIFNANIDYMLVAFFNRIILRRKNIVVFYDLLLHSPNSIKSKILCIIKQYLLKGVDFFICNHKDFSSYQEYYKVALNRFRYIPFKANNYDILSQFKSVDGDYILSCGASYRDFNTFIAAVKELAYPCKIILPPEKTAKHHNTFLDEKNLPLNVEIIRHDYNYNSWNRYMADARLVVIPIQKRALQSAGVSVYLEAMALGKPVIITEGTSTKGILTNREAEIVPSEDPESLAVAIKKIWEHKNYRESLSENGKKYALSLGGEERLVKDILKEICVIHETKGKR
jgi:glycosyltransferase involved in cell wall biosynthesis